MSIAEDTLEMDSRLLEQEVFQSMLLLERRRTERSKNPFVLMLLKLDGFLPERSAGEEVVEELAGVLSRCTRDTDIVGWYEESSTIGVMFCESCGCAGKEVADLLVCRLKDELKPYFSSLDTMNGSLSFHFFPEEHGTPGPFSEPDVRLYPELARTRTISKLEDCLKRSMDILGSLALLVGLFPLFVAVSALIKCTSKGPVLFKQERVGQFGKKFTLLKFRTMLHKCDSSSHKDFMKVYIKGQTSECRPAEQDGQEGEKPVFKSTNDSRVTPIGRFLRKTSLDELPQCINVLMGEMSLVGPRPPIPYEVECYDIWHRRRILEMKPGLTGLWQVTGRSQTTFDELVRLDLRYTREWSLWLDIKILFRTAIVVITGKGGY